MADDLRESDYPELCCPVCSDGRRVAYAKDVNPSKPAWRLFSCGHFVDDRAQANAAMTPDLRTRMAEALIARIKQSVIPDPYMPGMASIFGATEYDLADVVLAVRDDELERLRAQVAQYENTITWGTSCHGCARILDSSIRETERAEKAEAELARLKAEGARDA